MSNNLKIEEPLVSVLLLSMNHAKLIERCINSIENQTYKNIEIIYLDNASSDGTYDIAEGLLKNSRLNFKVFKNLKSKPISTNLNILLSESKGEYISPISADDWLTIDSISEKISYYLNNPQFGLLYHNSIDYFEDTGLFKVNFKKIKAKEGWVLSDILKDYFISTTGYIIKKSTFQTVGNYDEKSLLEDWEFCIRVAEKFPIGYINKELAYYSRNNTKNISSNFNYMLKGFEYIANKYSHYNEIKVTKKYILNQKIYFLATYEQSLKNLFFIIKNPLPSFFYIKQITKAVYGVSKNLIFKNTTSKNAVLSNS